MKLKDLVEKYEKLVENEDNVNNINIYKEILKDLYTHREYLSKTTKKGVEKARLNGKQIGQVKGKKLTTKKSIKCKEDIVNMSIDFNGNMRDEEVMFRIGVSRNTYYKYKKELKNTIK